MARIIREFTNGNATVVTQVTSYSVANEIYDTLKQSDAQLAIKFMELFRYFQFTGKMMPN